MSNAGIFAQDSKTCVELDATSSALPLGMALLSETFGSNAHLYILCIAKSAFSSTATITIASKGTASSLTTGTFTAGVTGGVPALTYFWAKKTLL